ncbi:MAG: hypothetical protein Q9165_002436 [Trypethelium subeluteriae]
MDTEVGCQPDNGKDPTLEHKNDLEDATELPESLGFHTSDGKKNEDNEEHQERDVNEYPHGTKLVTLTIALMLAIFMVALDTNIIACGILALLINILLLDSYSAPWGSDLPMGVKLRSLDAPGVALSIITSVLLLLALKWGGLDYSWNSAHVLGCLIGSGLCLALFVTIQARQRQTALISLHVLCQPTVLFGSLFVCFLNMAIDTHIYYLPLYFQAVDGVSASISGVRILPYLATMIVSAGISGALISLTGYYVPFMIFGSALFTVGSALIHTLRVESGVSQWVGYQLITGIGFGTTFQIPYSALHTVLDAKDLATGNALIVFFQALGGALAVSVGQNVLSNELIQRLNAIPQISDPHAILASGATNVVKVLPARLVPVVVEAYSYALSRTFILPIGAAGMAFLCSFGMDWKKITKEAQK